MTTPNWRDHEVVQDAVGLTRLVWNYGKKAPPMFDAIAGVAILLIFVIILPLVLHIFFEGGVTPGGIVVDIMSRAISIVLRLIGVVCGCICLGWATRGFLDERRRRVADESTAGK